MKKKYESFLRNKTLLITGGTGSFGHSVVKVLLPYKPKQIIIFSRDEKKQFDMRNFFDTPLLRFVIGDVRDRESVDSVMGGIDYVFHAAALKQVPTCEFFPMEAIKTNVLGANNVIQSAVTHDVQKVVVLSTDKAAYPINVMGMSKAMMEKLLIAKAKRMDKKQKTKLCIVRYGNVLYTRGSIVPYFISLMKQQRKLPVTHFQMTRFLLPLTDAVDLVLHALVKGENGHLYVRKSPAATLETITKALCLVFNYKHEYFEVGIRAGEKMHETLITTEEILRAKEEVLYYDIPSESQGLDYNRYFSRGKKEDMKKYDSFTSENTKRLNLEETKTILRNLPEIKEILSKGKKR